MVGAAYNLWRSINGVKWSIEMRRLVGKGSQTKEKELKAVLELHHKAEELKINYDDEIKKELFMTDIILEFKTLVDSIKDFDNQFGNRERLVKTLESVWEKGKKDS